MSESQTAKALWIDGRQLDLGDTQHLVHWKGLDVALGESKHTPKPWFTFNAGRCVGGACENNATGTAGIAMCNMSRRKPEEVLANATLISAAPDEHEALINSTKLIETLWSFMKTGENEHQIKLIIAQLLENRAAIAKATGGMT